MNYYIETASYFLPEIIIDNNQLHEKAGIDPVFLESKVGIKKRHILSENETTSDLAVNAAKKLFTENDIDPGSIEVLIVCTQNPDFRLPTTACIVQERLGLKTSCIAFDVNLGCSGFVYSMVIAGNFIKSGISSNALIIMADAYSKIIDYKDKNTASLFGDAGSATLLNSCEEGAGVLAFDFGTDGKGADKLIAYNSGVCRTPEKPPYLFMDGREIFKFSITVVPQSINSLLEKSGFQIGDIRYFIFHQANKYMLTEIQKKLSIPEEKMVFDLEDYGNTVSSTIPIALSNLLEKNSIKKGDFLVLSGFGVGLSWGSILYKHL